MKKLLIIFFIVQSFGVYAQNVTITPSGITPAMSGTYPRISYDAIMALPSPVLGDMVFDTSFKCLRVYTGSKWLCTYQSPNDPPNMIALASAGGTGYEFGNGIAVDGTGNVYITGSYSGIANFGGINKTSEGGSMDIFVAKYNKNGVIQWVESAGGTSSDEGTSIAVDGSGNVYITGNYQGAASFSGMYRTSAGGEDIFIAKYNSSGEIQWVQSEGGLNIEKANDIALDGSGNIYITGYYQNNTNFGGTTKTSSGGYDIFITKYNISGVLQWVNSIGGIGTDKGVGIIASGSSIYVIGDYSNSVNFGGGYTKNSLGSWDTFVAKYNSSGTIQWVESAGSTGIDFGKSIAVDVYGYVYIVGYFKNPATFGTFDIFSEGGFDIYVAKYNSSGMIQWVQSAGGTEDDFGFDIALDGSGNVYIIGEYRGTATFNNSSFTSKGYDDIYVTKYANNGLLQWVKTAGGKSEDTGRSITVDGSGKVYFTGNYKGIVTIGNSSLTSLGNQDVYIGVLDN